MVYRVTVPQVSANVDDVTVTAWFKAVDEPLRRGEPIAEVTTDKAAFEIESPSQGILLECFAPPKSVVPIGYCIALVGDAGETDEEVVAENRRLMEAYRRKAGIATASDQRGNRRERGARVRATPRARRLARQHGIDLRNVKKETGAETITEATLAPYLEKADPAGKS